MTIQPSNSSLMADAFCRALTPDPRTVAFYETLRQALIEIDAEDALHDLGMDADELETAQ